MHLPRITASPTPDADLRRAQDAMGRAFRQLGTLIPWLDGSLLDSEGSPPAPGITFAAATPRDIPHRLGRAARGFLVVGDFGANASSLVHDAANSNAFTIRLTSATACTVKLWVW